VRGHEDAVRSAAFSPDGARIVTASEDRTVRLWDATTGQEIIALRGHQEWVPSAAFSPDGAHRHRLRGPHGAPLGHHGARLFTTHSAARARR
jgi:WD40 repeat protein